MGTNYYLRTLACLHCGSCGASLHIGKSSGGWNFGLRIYPADNDGHYTSLAPFGVTTIDELKDWQPLFELFQVFDEYDREVSASEMLEIITERSHPNGLKSRCTAGPDEMGPWRVDAHPGKGTYDLCNYEFS